MPRSVADLSLARTATALPDSRPHALRTPSSPSQPMVSQGGLGDLSALKSKPWSKSADDLGKMSPTSTSPKLTPIDTTLYQKIKTYRSDSVSSSAAPSPSPLPSPSASSLNMNYPFPVISAELSTSPPKNTRLGPPMSNHASPITPPLTPSSSTSSHVHSRSHSFTPRLPSKLSGPKPSGLVPPSPKRKGSASSESRESERDKGSSGSGTSGRSPFPFGFGGAGNVKTPPEGYVGQVPSSPTLLAPPKIVEPEESGNKRASQMVHHAGFINRMSEFSPAMLNNRAHQAYIAGGAQQVLAKGWKPFKLVLKGSKLYFYKPPSDRSAGIRELFPTELVAVLEDETGDPELRMDIHDSEMDMSGRGGGKGKEREEMRRRRAYWGRGTHPSLVVGKEGVEKGTTEALVHEAVFATTFAVSQAESAEDGASTTSRYRPEWHGFAAAVVFSLPSLVGKAVFETELHRLASNLVNGAAEEMREEEVRRIEWLAGVYLDYHGPPANKESWDSWCKDISPSFSPAPAKAAVPEPSSSQTTPTPSHHVPAGLGSEEGTGPPRPGPNDSRMESIIEALGGAAGTQQMPSRLSFSPDALKNALEEEGLSRDVLLSLDPALIARSFAECQQAALQNVPDNFAAEYVLGPGAQDPSEATSPSTSASPANTLMPFLGNDERPHWLTRLVLIQVLVPEPAGTVHMPSNDGRSVHAPRSHSRSEVISAWAGIAELARRGGDECSWRAIMAALCSRPIARLDKVWKRVDAEALSAVQCWVQILVRGDQPTPTAPLAFPWAGDAERDIREALEKARGGEGVEWAVACLRAAREKFDEIRTTFALCRTRAQTQTESAPPDSRVDVLLRHWIELSSDTETRGLAAKFLRYVGASPRSSAVTVRSHGFK